MGNIDYMSRLEIDLDKYSIIKEYKVFPSGSTCVELKHSIKTERDRDEYSGFMALFYEQIKEIKRNTKQS